MKKLPQLLLALVLTLAFIQPAAVDAGGVTVTGGGDESALEFHEAFAAAFRTLQKDIPGILSADEVRDLLAVSKDARVIVVNTALTTPHDGVVQFSIAENDPERKLIFINRTRWNALRNPRVREALALHEMASLLKLESTGRYPISAQYIAHFALAPGALEPVKGRCFAPRSEESSCEAQVQETGFTTFAVDSTRSFENATTGQFTTIKAHLRGQQALFFDENKIYALQFIAASEAPTPPQISFSIVSERPTGVPDQAEITRLTRTLSLQQGKLVGSPLEDRRYLMNRGDGQTAQAEIRDAQTGKLTGGFFNEYHPDGTSLEHTYERNLSTSPVDGMILRSTMSTVSTAPAKGLAPLSEYDLPGEFETIAAEMIRKFRARNEAANEIKTRLNRCRDNCALLRASYEKADRERDEFFLSLH